MKPSAVHCHVTGAGGSEHDTGDEDEPSNQQERQEVEHHQEAQEHEVGLDTTAKVASYLMQSLSPQSYVGHDSPCICSEPAQGLGLAPLPRLPASHHRHTHRIALFRRMVIGRSLRSLGGPTSPSSPPSEGGEPQLN